MTPVPTSPALLSPRFLQFVHSFIHYNNGDVTSCGKVETAMKSLAILSFLISTSLTAASTRASRDGSRDVSQKLFDSLEELARVVDVSYCVGSTGIHQPFECLSRCKDFQGFELITVCYISVSNTIY